VSQRLYCLLSFYKLNIVWLEKFALSKLGLLCRERFGLHFKLTLIYILRLKHFGFWVVPCYVLNMYYFLDHTVQLFTVLKVENVSS